MTYLDFGLEFKASVSTVGFLAQAAVHDLYVNI